LRRPGALAPTSQLLVLLVAIDLVSKVAALALLPWSIVVDRDALFEFALQLNEAGIGTAGTFYFSRFPLPDVLAGLVGYLAATFALSATRGRGLGLWRRIAITVAAYLVPSILAQPAAGALWAYSPRLAVGALRALAVLWIGTLWWIAPGGLTRLGLTLLLAAGIGNGLSLLYPPFRIVDFMYSWLTATVLRLGIFNMADLYIPAGAACLLAAAARYIVRRVRGYRAGKAVTPS